MELLSAIHVSDLEKLEILRKLDQFRRWNSVDDKRYCLACGKLVSGRQIRVVEDMRGSDPLRIICPTERCPAIPMDWVLPTAEVLARASAPTPIPVTHGSAMV